MRASRVVGSVAVLVAAACTRLGAEDAPPALAKRCGATSLGREADATHWFSKSYDPGVVTAGE